MANPLVELLATIKGLTSTIKLVATPEGHLYTARYLPDNARAVQDGGVWGFMDTTATTFVTTLPTTASLEYLYNNEPSGGKSYILLGAMCHIVTAGAGAAEDFTLLGGVTSVKEGTVPTNDFVTRFNMKSLVTAPGSSASIVDRALTLASNPGWFVLGGVGRPSAVNDDGNGIYVDLSNRGIILPPNGGGFAMTVVGTAAGTGNLGAIWMEHQFS